MRFALFLIVASTCLSSSWAGKRTFTKYKCLEREQKGLCTRQLAPVCAIVSDDKPNRCAACEGRKSIRYWDGACDDRLAWTKPLKHKCLARETNGICTLELLPVCVQARMNYNNKCLPCEGKEWIRYSSGEC